MKLLAFLVSLICGLVFFVDAAAQTADVQKVIETEKAFAAASDAAGMKRAFLEFLADDSVMFAPEALNGKQYFRARADNLPATLAWRPVFADVSANGVLGYTTGYGEFRPNGRASEPVFYSDFATVWRRQADGNYRAVLDIGISRGAKPGETADKIVASSPPEVISSAGNKTSAADFVNAFYDDAAEKGLTRTYRKFADAAVRFLRDGAPTISGKAAAPAEPGKTKVSFGKNMTLQSADNLAYAVTTYQFKDKAGKATETGNLVQIWKRQANGDWRIVLDAMSLIPIEKP